MLDTVLNRLSALETSNAELQESNTDLRESNTELREELVTVQGMLQTTMEAVIGVSTYVCGCVLLFCANFRGS
jgi:hypothetical protein